MIDRNSVPRNTFYAEDERALLSDGVTADEHATITGEKLEQCNLAVFLSGDGAR